MPLCVWSGNNLPTSVLSSHHVSPRNSAVARLGSRYLYPASHQPRWPFYHGDDLRIAGEAASVSA